MGVAVAIRTLEDPSGDLYGNTAGLYGSGVYFTQDEVVSRVSSPAAPGREAQLEQENQQLRQQLEDSKRKGEE
jgi:hypothetical protein